MSDYVVSIASLQRTFNSFFIYISVWRTEYRKAP